MTDVSNDQVDGQELEAVVDDQVEDQIVDDQGEEGGDEEADDQTSQDDDSEEIEHEGAKYRIPKALKPALMMQADYTRKTTELAESRKAWEAERTQAQAEDEEVRTARIGMALIDRRLEEFKALSQADWDAIEAANPEQAKRLWREFTLLPQQKAEAENALKTTESKVLERQQQAVAKQFEEGHAVLARDIPGWGPELGGKLASFAEAEFGLKPAELDKLGPDPRLIKILHRAFENTQAKKQASAQANAVKAVQAKPAATVTGKGAVKPGLHDGLSDDEWFKREREQREKKQAQRTSAYRR